MCNMHKSGLHQSPDKGSSNKDKVTYHFVSILKRHVKYAGHARVNGSTWLYCHFEVKVADYRNVGALASRNTVVQARRERGGVFILHGSVHSAALLT